MSLERSQLIGVSVLLVQSAKRLRLLFLCDLATQGVVGVKLIVGELIGVSSRHAVGDFLRGIDARLIPGTASARNASAVVLLY